MHQLTPLGANSRRRIRLVVAVAVAAVWASSTCLPAGADTSTTIPTTVTPVSVSDGFLFSGARITAPNTTPRLLSPYNTAAFVQGWIGQAIDGHPAHTKPPASATIYRVDVTGTWGGGAEFTTRAVYYASDGTQAWISFPSPVGLPPTGAPAHLDFFVASATLLIPAFAGHGNLIPTVSGGTAPSSSIPSPGTGSGSGSGNSSSSWIWIVVAAVVAAGAVAALARRRWAKTA